jgi:hypothetical protein
LLQAKRATTDGKWKMRYDVRGTSTEYFSDTLILSVVWCLRRHVLAEAESVSVAILADAETPPDNSMSAGRFCRYRAGDWRRQDS